ncbi:hypothetical protein GOBAR_DD20367 [Gossypium barbadense]|nr:hypothetical protein GOBAR_DD20367 [Gossypium barbadense]
MFTSRLEVSKSASHLCHFQVLGRDHGKNYQPRRFTSFNILLLLTISTALNTITPSKSIKDPDVIISQNGVFRLGFFSLANSSNRYVGQIETGLSKTLLGFSPYQMMAILLFPMEKLKFFGHRMLPIQFLIVQLLASGNLVLSNGDDGASSLWESFEDPSNAFIETMKISTDVKKGRKVDLKSWKSIDDPSDGNFSLGFEPFNIPEGIIRKKNQLYFRTGPWNGYTFIGLINMYTSYLQGFVVVADNPQQPYCMTHEFYTDSILIYGELDSQGKFIERRWDAGKGNWINKYSSYQTDCDVYGYCGAFGICDSSKQPICSCLKRFKPRNIEEWSRGNWSSGCFRTTPLQCQRDNNNGSGAGQGDDGFLEMKNMKVPVFPHPSSVSNGECKDQCMKNCSCVAYAYDDGIGCMLWSGDLIDISPLAESIFTFVCHLRNSGTLHAEKEIAVKRLSKASGKGLEEFMNEVGVTSKLQHRNLVRLLGCCVEEENMLVYEYMPNKSLDVFLFG